MRKSKAASRAERYFILSIDVYLTRRAEPPIEHDRKSVSFEFVLRERLLGGSSVWQCRSLAPLA